jgi:hypothetical protein
MIRVNVAYQWVKLGWPSIKVQCDPTAVIHLSFHGDELISVVQRFRGGAFYDEQFVATLETACSTNPNERFNVPRQILLTPGDEQDDDRDEARLWLGEDRQGFLQVLKIRPENGGFRCFGFVDEKGCGFAIYIPRRRPNEGGAGG